MSSNYDALSGGVSAFGGLGRDFGRVGRLGALGTAQPLVLLKAGLIASGGWAKAIAIYIPQTTQAASLQNFKNPGTGDLTAVNSPTFAANRGFTGDGVSAHLIGPTYDGVFAPGGYAQNNASVLVWSGANVQTGVGGSGGGIIGTDAAGALVLFNAADANNAAAIRANSSPSDNIPAPSPINLVGFSRSASGQYNGFVNKQKTVILTASAGTPTTQHVTFLRSNTTYTQNRFVASFIGTPLTDAEYNGTVDAINRYLAAIGAFDASGWGVDGVWTWFNDPRAITISSKPTIGLTTANGTPSVAQNETTRLITRGVLHNTIGVDDHDNPALLRRVSDGKIIAHYSKHSADTTYYQRVSTNADDISLWGAETNIGTQYVAAGPIVNLAYANLFQLTGESNKLFSFYRAQFTASASDMTTHYSTSADDGVTWTQGVRLFWINRPYFKAAQNGTARIDILLSSRNPTDDGGVAPCSIYHCYYQAGVFSTSAGVSMGSPPFTELQPTQIYNSTATGKCAWNWDIVIDGSNNPVACFAVFQTATDHRYNQARWNGSSWSYHEICTAGRDLYPIADRTEIFYSGGVITDPTDINTVYCSRQVDSSGNINTTNGIFQIFKYVTADSGVTWTGTQLTFGSSFCFRPYIPAGSRTLLYCKGTYTSYVNYQTTIESLAI